MYASLRALATSAQGGRRLRSRTATGHVYCSVIGCRMQFDRITSQPDRMNGQPCVRDLRLTVKRVLEIVATHQSRDDIRREYPELEDEDIVQALCYAAIMLDDAVVPLFRTA